MNPPWIQLRKSTTIRQPSMVVWSAGGGFGTVKGAQHHSLVIPPSSQPNSLKFLSITFLGILGWMDGPNWDHKRLKNGPNPWVSKNDPSPVVNSPKVSLEKHIFDPFLTDFWSQNNPFSRHFVTLEGPKWLAMGSKRAHFTCLCTPNGLGSFLEKHIFDPFLTHFWSQNSPFSRLFVPLEGPKWLAMGSKWTAHSTGVCTPNSSKVSMGKHIFDPFFVIFKRSFVSLEGPKWLAVGSKRAHFTCAVCAGPIGNVTACARVQTVHHKFTATFKPPRPPARVTWVGAAITRQGRRVSTSRTSARRTSWHSCSKPIWTRRWARTRTRPTLRPLSSWCCSTIVTPAKSTSRMRRWHASNSNSPTGTLGPSMTTMRSAWRSPSVHFCLGT